MNPEGLDLHVAPGLETPGYTSVVIATEDLSPILRDAINVEGVDISCTLLVEHHQKGMHEDCLRESYSQAKFNPGLTRVINFKAGPKACLGVC